MKNKTVIIFQILLLITLFALVTFFTIRFANTDKTPLYYDQANHMNYVFSFYSAFIHNEYSKFLLTASYYPPLMYWILTLFILIFGYSKMTILLLNMSLLCILLITIFFITRRKNTPQIAGVCTIFSLGFIIHITQIYTGAQLLYEFMLDFPLIVITCIAYYITRIGITQKIKRKKIAFIIGVICGLSVLTKATALSLVAIPLSWYIIANIKKIQIVFYTIIGFLIGGGWWYIYHFKSILLDYAAWSNTPFWPTPFMYYFSQIRLTSAPLILLWLIPLAFIIAKTISRQTLTITYTTSYRKDYIFLFGIFNCIFSLLIYQMITFREYRFILPSLFLLGLLFIEKAATIASKKQFMILTIAIIAYTSSIIWILQPRSSTDVYAINRIQNYIQEYSLNDVGIFMEDNPNFGGRLFNKSTFQYKLTEYQLFQNKKFHFSFINDINDNRLNFCDINQKNPWVIVYSSPLLMRNQNFFADYATTCPKSFRDSYTLFLSETESDGKIQLFQKTH